MPFQKIQLNSQFYSEGINFGVLNRDGVIDVIAGPYYYPGPDFTKKVAFRAPKDTPFDYNGDSDCYSIFVFDFNGDGWPDILSTRTPGGAEAVWYENPKGAGGYWPEHVVAESVNDESAVLADIQGDGKPELLTVSNGFGGWMQPDWSHPNEAWAFNKVTDQNPRWGSFTHGIGAGDVNGDGRSDLILPEGWWEQPSQSSAVPWIQRKGAFWAQEDPSETYGGAQMFAYDVDGDGRNDIITSLQAHAWGLSWFQNVDTAFVEHRIMDNRSNQSQYNGIAFAQLHAVALADLDGDGLKDIITGKRKGAHGYGLGSEVDSPAVLYWFRLIREAGKPPHYQPYLIDSQAGVGTQLIVADVNNDGAPDVLTAGRQGAFVFLNQKKPNVSLRRSRAGFRLGASNHPSRGLAGDLFESDLLGRTESHDRLDEYAPHMLIIAPK